MMDRDALPRLIPSPDLCALRPLFLKREKRVNLGLIDRVTGRICRIAYLPDADAEDFASTVKLALMENDYTILRAWQRRASLASYLTIVVQRLLHDERSRTRVDIAAVLARLPERPGRPRPVTPIFLRRALHARARVTS